MLKSACFHDNCQHCTTRHLRGTNASVNFSPNHRQLLTERTHNKLHEAVPILRTAAITVNYQELKAAKMTDLVQATRGLQALSSLSMGPFKNSSSPLAHSGPS